jgi:hypothetical protein
LTKVHQFWTPSPVSQIVIGIEIGGLLPPSRLEAIALSAAVEQARPRPATTSENVILKLSRTPITRPVMLSVLLAVEQITVTPSHAIEAPVPTSRMEIGALATAMLDGSWSWMVTARLESRPELPTVSV